MHWIIIAMLALALVTGFGVGWAAGTDALKTKLLKLSSQKLLKWAAKARREGGL